MNGRQAAALATKAKTREAAARLFEAYGYEATTIRQIASEMGMSTGALFASYPDKPTLYASVFGHLPVSPELGRKLLLGLREYFTGDADPDAALRALADLSVAAEAEVSGCPE